MRVLITLWKVGKRKTGVRGNIDLLKRHGSVNGDKTSNTTNPKGDYRRQFLTASSGTLAELLERGIGGESYGRVGALPHHLKSPRECIDPSLFEQNVPRGTVHDK